MQARTVKPRGRANGVYFITIINLMYVFNLLNLFLVTPWNNFQQISWGGMPPVLHHVRAWRVKRH